MILLLMTFNNLDIARCVGGDGNYDDLQNVAHFDSDASWA